MTADEVVQDIDIVDSAFLGAHGVSFCGREARKTL